MAIIRGNVSQRLIGLSTDVKPTDRTIKPGYEMIETDTGLRFVFDGSTWHDITFGANSNVTSPVTVLGSALPTNAAQETSGNLAAAVAGIGARTDRGVEDTNADANLTERITAIVHLLAELFTLANGQQIGDLDAINAQLGAAADPALGWDLTSDANLAKVIGQLVLTLAAQQTVTPVEDPTAAANLHERLAGLLEWLQSVLTAGDTPAAPGDEATDNALLAGILQLLGSVTSGGAGLSINGTTYDGNPLPVSLQSQLLTSVSGPILNSGDSVELLPSFTRYSALVVVVEQNAAITYTFKSVIGDDSAGIEPEDVAVFDLDNRQVVPPGTVIQSSFTGLDAPHRRFIAPLSTGIRLLCVDSSDSEFGAGVTIAEIESNFAYGLPGYPAGGVGTVQGDPSGTPLPVAGSVSQSTPLAFEAASAASRVSADITITGSGLTLIVQLDNKAGSAPTITPRVEGKTASGAYYDLWTAADALAGNGTYTYQIAPNGSASTDITEGVNAPVPGIVRINLDYGGTPETDSFDTTVDIDVTP